MSETKSVLEQIKKDLPENIFEQIDGCDDAVIGIEYGALRLVYSYKLLFNMYLSQGKSTHDAVYTIAKCAKIKNGLVILSYDKFEH